MFHIQVRLEVLLGITENLRWLLKWISRRSWSVRSIENDTGFRESNTKRSGLTLDISASALT